MLNKVIKSRKKMISDDITTDAQQEIKETALLYNFLQKYPLKT